MKKLTIILFMLLLPAAIIFAQEDGPVAVLEYFDNPDGVFILTAGGEDLFPEYGMELYPGDQIKTVSSVAEIRLNPNGSLIKLATGTDFIIDTLQNRGGAEANTFTLVTGKLKAVAARTGVAQYQIKTQTAVCGVRGTIFGLQVIPGASDAALVEKGLVTFQKIATGETLELGAGQFADTFAAAFQAIAASADQMASFFEGIEQFVGENMNPDAVPGNEPVAEAAEEEGTPAEEPIEEPGIVEEPAGEEEPSGPSFMDPVMEYLRDVLGMQIGSITIEGRTYSKAVLQPHFALGKLKLGLYLPIIYESNMFDPEDWYHPKGNDEWSFGTDYNFDADPVAYVTDILSDTFLKIRYLEWGEQRDKFYLKVGNLNNMTIGHGLLMRNYANDDNFPAIRRIGVNTGLDLGGFGFEAVANDLAEPEIFGGRLYFRPFKGFRLAFGFSGIVDIDPAGEIPVDSDGTSTVDPQEAVGDPMFINAGIDLDLPIMENDFLSIVIFGDIGGMMPYLRNSITDGVNTVEKGLVLQALYNPDVDIEAGELPLRNYGIAAGVLGNIWIMDYRVEYRNYNGTFRPTFFNTNYDRSRGEYAVQIYNELLTPKSVEKIVGVYGEAGFTIGKNFRFEAGYMWPWKEDFEFGDEDYLHLEAEIFKGLIPKIDIHGSVAYDRYKFIPTLIGTDAELTLFDANTVVKGEVIYPVAPTLDLAILVTTTVAHDDEGNVLLDAKNGQPQVNPSISIETRVHF